MDHVLMRRSLFAVACNVLIQVNEPPTET